MKKVLGVFFLLCILAEQSRAIFFNTLNGLLQPPQASPPMPPGPTYVAYIDPNPPKPPVRPHYIPKAYPEYVVRFASPGGGIGLGSYSGGSPPSYSPSYGSSNYDTNAYNTAAFGSAVNAAGIYGASALINDAQGAVAAAMAPSASSSSSSLFSSVVGADGNILLKNPEDALRQSPEGQAFLAYNQQAAGSAASLQNVFLDGPAHIFNPHQQSLESVSPVASSHSNIAIPSGSQFGSAQMTSGIGVTNQNAGPDLGGELSQLTEVKGNGSPGTVSDVQIAAKPEPRPASGSASPSSAPVFSPPPPPPPQQSSSLSPIPTFDKSKSASLNPTLSIDGLPDIRLVIAPNRNRNKKPNAEKDSEMQSPRSIFHSSKLRDGEGRHGGNNPPYFPNFPVPSEENIPSGPWYVVSTPGTPVESHPDVPSPTTQRPVLVIETVLPEDDVATEPSVKPSKRPKPSQNDVPFTRPPVGPNTPDQPPAGSPDIPIGGSPGGPIGGSPGGPIGGPPGGPSEEPSSPIEPEDSVPSSPVEPEDSVPSRPGRPGANDAPSNPASSVPASDVPLASPAASAGGGGFPGFFMPSLSMPGMGGMQPRPGTAASDVGSSVGNTAAQASPGFIPNQPFFGQPFFGQPFMQSPFMGNPFLQSQFAPPGNDALDIQVGEPIHVAMSDLPNGLRDVGFQPGFSNFQPSSLPSFQSPSFTSNFPNRPNRFQPNRRPPPNRDPDMRPNRPPPPNRDPEIPSPPREEFPPQNFQPQQQDFQPQQQDFQPQQQDFQPQQQDFQPQQQDFQPQQQEFQPQPQGFRPQQPQFQPSNNQEGQPGQDFPQPNFSEQSFPPQPNENVNYQPQQYPTEGFDTQGRNNFHNQQAENSFHLNPEQPSFGPQDFNSQFQSPVQTVIRGENGIIQVPEQPVEYAPQQNPVQMQGEIISVTDEKQPIFNEIQISTPRSETENEIRPGYPQEEIQFSQPQDNQPIFNVPQGSPQNVYNVPQDSSQPMYNVPQEVPQPVYTPPQDLPQPIYNPPQELPQPVYTPQNQESSQPAYTPQNQESPQIIYTIENSKPAYSNEQTSQAVFNQGQSVSNSYTPSQEKKQTGYAVEEEIVIPNQGVFGQRENINNQKASYGNSDPSSNVKIEQSAVPSYSVYPRGPDYIQTEASSPNSVIQEGVVLLEDTGYRPASQYQDSRNSYSGPSQEKQGYGEVSQDKQSNYQINTNPNSRNPETQNPEYEYKPIALLGPFYPPNPQEQAASSRYPSEDSFSQDKLGETGYDKNQKGFEYQGSSVLSEYRPSNLYNNQDPSQPSYEGSKPIPAYSGNSQFNFPVPSDNPQSPMLDSSNSEYKPILLAGPFDVPGQDQNNYQIPSDIGGSYSDSRQSYGANDINSQIPSSTEGYTYSPFGNDNSVSHSTSEQSSVGVTEKSDTDNSVSPDTTNSKSESGDDYDPVALIGPFGSRLHPISRKPNVHIKHIGQGGAVSEEASHSHDHDTVTASSIASYSTEYHSPEAPSSPSSEWFSHTESSYPDVTLNLNAGRFRSLDLSKVEQGNGLEITQEYGESVDSFSTVPAPMHVAPFPSRTPTIRKLPPNFENLFESVTEVPPSSSTDETPAYDPILMVGPFGGAESSTGSPLQPENEYNPNNPFGMFGERSSTEYPLTPSPDRNHEYNPVMMVGPFGEERSSTEIPIIASSDRSLELQPFSDQYPSSEAPHFVGMEREKYDPILMVGPFGGESSSTEHPPIQPQEHNQYDPIVMVGPFGGESPSTGMPEASTPENGAKYDPILMVGPFGGEEERSADASPDSNDSPTASPQTFEKPDGLKWYPSNLQLQLTTPSPNEVAESQTNAEEQKDTEDANPSAQDSTPEKSEWTSTLRSTPRRRRPGNRRRVLVNMRRKSTTKPPATYYPTTPASVDSSFLPYEETTKSVDNDVAESIDSSQIISGNILETEKPDSSNAVNPSNELATEDEASETASSATVSYEVTSTDSGVKFGSRLHPKRRLIQHRRK